MGKDTIITANGIKLNLVEVDQDYKNTYGIYLIYNKTNRKCYVGQTNNLYNRKIQHLSSLVKGNHKNTHIQSSYNKYGNSEFSIYILEILNDLNVLNDSELYYIKLLQSRLNNYGYNIKSDTYNRKNENKQSNAGVELPSRWKPVIQLDLQGNLISRYDSVSIAGETCNIHFSTISRCCMKNRGTAGGSMWIFEDEYNIDDFNFETYVSTLHVTRIQIKKNSSSIGEIVTKNPVQKVDVDYTVLQLDNKGNLIKTWLKPIDTKAFGFNPEKIYLCCSGKSKTHKGFVWIYKRNTKNNN